MIYWGLVKVRGIFLAIYIQFGWEAITDVNKSAKDTSNKLWQAVGVWIDPIFEPTRSMPTKKVDQNPPNTLIAPSSTYIYVLKVRITNFSRITLISTLWHWYSVVKYTYLLSGWWLTPWHIRNFVFQMTPFVSWYICTVFFDTHNSDFDWLLQLAYLLKVS